MVGLLLLVIHRDEIVSEPAVQCWDLRMDAGDPGAR